MRPGLNSRAGSKTSFNRRCSAALAGGSGWNTPTSRSPPRNSVAVPPARAAAATWRPAGARAGGPATLFRGGDRDVGVFHPLPPANAALQRRLKDVFDAARLFNPGRMYPDL